MSKDGKILFFNLCVKSNAKQFLAKEYIIKTVSSNKFSQVAGTKKIGKNIFQIKVNPLRLHDTDHILHVVLHELGHIQHWVDIEDTIMSEYLAESWALIIIKNFYPTYYKDTVKQTIENVMSISSLEHRIGYYEALRSIGEWKDG